MCKRLYAIFPFLTLLALSLSACVIESEQPDLQTELGIDYSGFTAYYDLTAGVIPTPNNLLFINPDTGLPESTLQIPQDDTDPKDAPKRAMNALDGFSTIAPITARFSGQIEPASVNATTVYLFKVALQSVPGSAIDKDVTPAPLDYGTDYIATVDSSGTTVAILPLRPLDPQSHYLVALTTDIQNADGFDTVIPAHYAIAKTPNPLTGAAVSLEPVRQLVNAQEDALADVSIDSSIVLLSWTFSTQSVGDVLSQAQTQATGSSTGFTLYNTTTGHFSGQLGKPGPADIYFGELTLPYYLDPTAPLTGFWQGASGSDLTQYNTTPVAKGRGTNGTEIIPLLLTVPTGSKPPETGKWPVVIFQHGITGNRMNMLGVADALALRGFAVVAIDLPLHGIDPGFTLRTNFERTFDLDLVDNATKVEGDNTDLSGTHFINLSSLLTSRDNLRQAVADLFALKAALATMDYDGDGGNDFDTRKIYFFGHSLGAMVGSVFLALDTDPMDITTVKDAVLAMPGGGIAKLLDGSVTFGPLIAAGLAANGVIKGTADYESFLGAAQTVLDSADPLNYAADVTTNRGVLMYEIIGDMTIPNDVFANAPAGTVPSPTAGTKPLAKWMGLDQIDSSTTGINLTHLIRFSSGFHSQVLNSPIFGDANATAMQALAADFFANIGDAINLSIKNVPALITDYDLTDVEPVP